MFPLFAAQSPHSPHVGEEAREIKSLSKNEVSMYLQGAGMGLARAAELNSYPGPMHVLELASELGLSEEQHRQTETLFSQTKAEARKLGEDIVELEQELDQFFLDERISEDELSRLVGEIGTRNGELRLVHLRAHLRQRAILSRDQTELYMSLRGYGGDN